ncbi:TWiK family of potassium channels protein 7-like [Chelonus insularis]|uniref:TWiK family of potassium channels protein 7-like n=1 Tax=Chelonus insularis TaxID=460826 RepID=UPI0015884380|nr:TWiK family of potassium channels protein 7-like [Chelonus insularis]
MDKDRHYRTYDGFKAANNGNTSSLKRLRESSKPQSTQIGCLCFGGVPDFASRHSFLKGFIINLCICAALVTYTIVGSFIFLNIEGDVDGGLHQKSLPTISKENRHNTTDWINKVLKNTRLETVQRLWQITDKFNVLYPDNWTRMTEQEISRFQENLVKTLTEGMQANHPTNTHKSSNNDDPTERKLYEYEWNFAKAFLYSLTVVTTVGFGRVAPKSNWGKIATMIYAFIGIPLTLVYLSSAGGLLSRCARGVFTRACCCCLCSKCGYCCYDERRMQEKERRMRRKRQQEEMNQQQQQQFVQGAFYLRDNTSTFPSSVEIKTSPKDEVSSLGSGDRPNVTIIAPVGICFGVMSCYIIAGAFTLYRLEGWDMMDASYFCFMSLTTIGFGDMAPGLYYQNNMSSWRNITLWFCSCYIIIGMALTAMCFNIIEDEIVHRFFLKNEKQESVKPSASVDELTSEPFPLTS